MLVGHFAIGLIGKRAAPFSKAVRTRLHVHAQRARRAAAEVFRGFFHDDDVPFTTTSGPAFAGITRSFSSFSEAAHENGESRIYAGIHFRSAVDDGIKHGKKIGAFAVTHVLRPLDCDDDDYRDR